MTTYVCTPLALDCCGHSFFAHQWRGSKKSGHVVCLDCPKEQRSHEPGR